MMNVKLPALVGICGNPKSGKSLVQTMLESFFSYTPVDDGLALRNFCMNELGLKWEEVYSQEGKLEHTVILGKRWQNRDLLGSLGKQLEDMFGEHIMPFIATRNLDSNKIHSFGSVRKTQGAFYRERGGIIIEIVNPDAAPSGYDFDEYDKSVVTCSILNDGLYRGLSSEAALTDLEEKVILAINDNLVAC
ncbi:MAG: hypothetical protein ACEQSB_00215 [Undibacterium sp.]